MNNPKTLFIGRFVSAQCWYRCALPSKHLPNSDWIGLHPVEENFDSGSLGVQLGGSIPTEPDYDDYEIIIVEQPRGEAWYKWIEERQKNGVKVLYENDDFLHGIWKIKDHHYRKSFVKKELKRFELCMRQCDGMISSTEFLADQYKKYNENQFVCKVAIDTERYDIELAPKENDTVNVGWAGGTGHDQAVKSWLTQLFNVMNRNPEVHFMSNGINYAEAINQHLPDRATPIPWVAIECYPYALSNFDIEICPSHDSKYFKSKSDLRWLEASALGIPTISNPITYSECPHTISVNSPQEFEEELEDALYDLDSIKEMGAKAKEYVQEHRDIRVQYKQWEDVQNSLS